MPTDKWMKNAYQVAHANLSGFTFVEEEEQEKAPNYLSAEHRALWKKGSEIYKRDGHCSTCHQADGNGLPAAGFPPLSNTEWVNGNEDRLIQITLHGLIGPISVKGNRIQDLYP